MDFGPSSHDVELKDIDMDSIRVDSKCWVFRVTERKDGRTVRSQRQDPLEPPMLYVKGRPLRIARLRAGFHVAASTRLLTEYHLPFLVAAIPVLVVAWKKFVRSA